MEPVISRPSALVLEDDPPSRKALAEIVRGEGFDVIEVASVEAAREQLAQSPPTVVLADLMLPDGTGLDIQAELAKSPGTDLVFVTGQATVDTVISALRNGARDYLTKPIDVARLKQILRDVARTRDLAAGSAHSLHEAERSGVFGRLIGRSRPMLKLYREIQRCAATQVTVLLQGDTGTGKEMVARTIHELSDRRDEVFVPLNCGAVSTTLIESELFGHEKGSFTGATHRHIGVFERAHQGTLFLDEITEMPLELQVRLLRVLETRSFNRVGGEKPVASEARLIAATNRAPEEAVREGKLREDLFYRLRVFPIQVPTLNRRNGDVALLAQRFLDGLNASDGTHKQFDEDALNWLSAQDWPGNVRELKNLVHRAFILSDGVIGIDCVRFVDEDEHTPVPAANEVRIPVGSTVAEAEKALILATLERFKGDKAKAARVLGISLKTLYNRLNVFKATP